jgi:16S rRNA (guanine966-N2)-methyltransferase
MRVISGFLKGRSIKGFDINGTRPTMDRVKESLFAIIQNDIKDAICLDLFAGSGNLGIEAISNGSKLVYFVDNNKEAIKVINENINNFNILNKVKVINDDYKKALLFLKNNNIKFDLIFLDPPYDYDIINNILNFIDDNNLLNVNGQVICELENNNIKNNYNNLKLYKEKKYGSKTIIIFRNIIE